jgi:hypothetical protein
MANNGAVDCSKGCGTTDLSDEDFMRQMMKPDAKWCCPLCGNDAWFVEPDEEVIPTQEGKGYEPLDIPF